jgi:hypothetical protein
MIHNPGRDLEILMLRRVNVEWGDENTQITYRVFWQKSTDVSEKFSSSGLGMEDREITFFRRVSKLPLDNPASRPENCSLKKCSYQYNYPSRS